MSTIIWIVFIGGGLILIWRLIVHPLLEKWHIAHNLFNIMDARDAGLGSRLRVALSGLKRKLFSRIVWICGLMMSLHELLLPHITTLQPLIPERYQIYMLPAMTVIGVVFEWLTKISVQPVDEVNPQVLATATSTSLASVVQATRSDPAVALPTQDQLAKAGAV